MKIGDRFIDFNSSWEMEITAISTDCVWATPAKINFAGIKQENESIEELKDLYSLTYTDLEYVESAVFQFDDDCMK